MKKFIVIFLGIFVLAIILPGILHAQPASQTHNYTFYVYVDPVFGDDNYAEGINNRNLLNPVGGTAQLSYTALTKHPISSSQNWLAPNGVLVMGGTPFQTITSALRYIKREFFLSTNPTPGQLPWPLPGGINTYINHIRIILLPGKYISGPRRVDPITGQKCGGESFPIVLPEHVSLIGTSVLNTVLDGQGETGLIRMFARPNMVTHEDCVIEKIHFTRAGGADQQTQSWNGPAIFMSYDEGTHETGGSCRPIIRDCLFTGNQIGIAIDNEPPHQWAGKWGFGYRHSPIILNNTFLWNNVGILNTCLVCPTGIPKVAGGRPRIWNNLVMTDRNSSEWPFVGVHYLDLRCSPGGTGSFKDYNAYDPQYLNQTGAPPVPLPAYWIQGAGYEPAMPNANPWLYPPNWFATIMDTNPYVGNLLFIRDVFARALAPAPNPSPHDYRLAPLTTQSSGFPNQLNPLVDLGIYLSTGGIFPANGCNNPNPGTWHSVPSNAAPALTSDPNSKWDGEGFGNPRSYDHPDYPGSGVDIGFDEMGDLIMAGYHNQTTIFNGGANNIPNGSGGYLNNPDTGYVYFFHNKYNPGNPILLPRPQATVETGNQQFWAWIQGTAAFNVKVQGDNLTSGDNGTARNGWNNTTPPLYPPFPRYQFCDTSPFLLLDYHPLWGQNVFADNYAANSWDHAFMNNYGGPALQGDVTDNPFHYNDPGAGITVQDETPNPPGTWVWTSSWGYLLGGASVSQWLPWTSTTYTVNAWGYGDVPTVDYIPYTGGVGVRYNCQVDPQNLNNQRSINIQSFRTVYGGGTASGKNSSSGVKWAPKTTVRTLDDIKAALRDAGVKYWYRLGSVK